MSDVVLAAGGVPWRWRDGVEVLVVYRSSHGEWSFPKGKNEPGEGDDVCALREVAEETGLLCRLGADLGEVRYVDRQGRPKRVRWWAMTVEDDLGHEPDHEIDAIRWLPLSEAEGLVSPDVHRAVLERFAAAVAGEGGP